jgi:diacylglycerol O-acyltransferase / wax synthase
MLKAQTSTRGHVVRRLTGADAYHLFEEAPNQHMHTLKVMVLGPTAGAPLCIDRVRAWLEEGVTRAPVLRWRLQAVPLRLALPLWIDDGLPDLGRHLFAVTLPSPGTDVELDELASRVASKPLDRSRPLWEAWFVDGFADGRTALILKLHHALADGGASLQLIEELFSGRPRDAAKAWLADGPAAGPPSRAALVRQALGQQVVHAKKLLPLVRRSALAAREARRFRSSGEGAARVQPFEGPSTPFDRGLTPERVYVNASLRMSDLQRIRAALGGTLNDVFVTLCGGALRRYLDGRGALPQTSLTAAEPVTTRSAGDPPYGNRVAMWYVSLRTDVADPTTRLGLVVASTAAARLSNERGIVAEWMDHYPLYRASLALARLGERAKGRPMFNAIVSNVRGPRPLALEGVPVVSVRSMGPIFSSLGLNITAWSYGDELAVGFHACAAVAPDLGAMRGHLADEAKALLDAAAAADAVHG